MTKAFTRILLVAYFFIGSDAHAQSIVRGRVIDRITREPLEMAIVTDLKTKHNVLTDQGGHFSLRGVSLPAVLEVSIIGFTPRKISVAGPALLTIGLDRGILDLKEVTVTNSEATGIGAFHTLSRLDLNLLPVRSAQDLLRLVPGLFIAQHQGGGKAEQIFLRGFDADHGTDVNISFDGMPVNMVSHAHGQGYADMHFIIPETVSGYEFGKGDYYTNKGDFTTAGYVAYNSFNVLDHNTIKIEGGEFGHARVVAMMNLLSDRARDKGQSAYLAGEGLYFDGPFHYGMHFNRGNLFGKFITPLSEASKLTLEAATFSSGWRSSGELPNRAIAEGYVKDRFGVIDSAQGGNTTRTNVMARLQTRLNDHLTLENQAYYTHYFLNLVSDFTFFYSYPAQGDEFRQHESRNLYGYNGKLSQKNYFSNATLTSTAGWGVRSDHIDPIYLAHTQRGEILNYLQLGNIRETALNSYLDETLQSGKWLFNAGARFDYLHFYYDSRATDSAAAVYHGVNPRAGKAILSPKLSAQYTIDPQTQIYVKLGKGFHSNDARIVIANQGYDILPAAYGADLGINWKPAPRLFINAALWYLYLKQEFTYGADLGDDAVSPGGRTRREGIDLSVRYQVSDWLFGYLNANAAHPRTLDVPKAESYIALAPTFTSTAGLDFRFSSGWNGGISYRYMHDRPGNEDNTLTASGYFITDMTVNYTRKKYEIGLIVENLFDTQWKESQFEELSRLKNETRPVDELSYTPGIPFFAKLKFSVFF
ncbi:MAG TPA: TonB-dependent receptor [Puia sp.]|jgi:hypothetical protein